MKKINAFAALIAAVTITFSSCGKEEKTLKSDAISFEEIALNENGYYNGSDGSGGFTSGNAKFITNFNTEWNSWSGFAVTNHTDTITPDYGNQYSSIVGSGAGASQKYAVLYSFTADTIEFVIPAKITNIAITNSTYAYYTLKNGNAIAKKFGGETGNDPDYFHLYISVVDDKGTELAFEDPIPLADYTYSDNTQDYIVKEWIYYNLSAAGTIKYLIFRFDSSDKSAWGINTPTYVCIDNLVSEWEE